MGQGTTLKNCPTKYIAPSLNYIYVKGIPVAISADNYTNFRWHPDYMLNSDLCPFILDTGEVYTSSQVAYKITKVRKTSKTLLIVDATCRNWGVINALAHTDSSKVAGAWLRVSFRHQGGANVLFLDSHVSYMKATGQPLDVAHKGTNTTTNSILWE